MVFGIRGVSGCQISFVCLEKEYRATLTLNKIDAPGLNNTTLQPAGYNVRFVSAGSEQDKDSQLDGGFLSVESKRLNLASGESR